MLDAERARPDAFASLEVSRRRFLQGLAVGAAAVAVSRWSAIAAETNEAGGVPWYRRTLRWGQVNLTERDPARFDVDFWREYWRRTTLQGVIVNAGGIVAYYPTQVPLHHRASELGERDLFGELCRAAQEDGLAVFARMDSNRAGEDAFRAHPDWFARTASGEPYLVTGLYLACVNGPYYEQHIPAVLREVATRYHPQGFTDNNWNGPMRHQPCFCANCEQRFKQRTGERIPRTANWNDPLYRDWILWNYERRLQIWELFDRTAREAGGPDCVWVGMMAATIDWQCRVFRDDREVYRRAPIVMLDHQRRPDREGFSHNAESGLRIHALAGWDKVVPESMAMYAANEHNFRLSAKPAPEVALWVEAGFAGGIQPWWHLVGGEQLDRRIFETAAPLWQWHRKHEALLMNRRAVATVGLLWSQRNVDFFGRDDAGALVMDPWNGFTQALVRARIPYLPVHADDLETTAAAHGLKVIVLPNLAALSDAQVAALRRFVERGGGLVATGMSTLCNEWGEPREDFALADVFGAHVPAGHGWRVEATRLAWARDWQQTYLRIPPNRAATPSQRVLRGFEQTELLSFGGTLAPLAVDAGTEVPLTYVPPVPIMPVENVWVRELATTTPGLVLREPDIGGRVAYLPADLDRRFARDYLPDHGTLLANLVRWAARDDLPLEVSGAGHIDCRLFEQEQRLILHVVNVTNPGAWRLPIHEFVPLGPLQIRVRSGAGQGRAPTVRALVSEGVLDARAESGWIQFELPRVVDHEVLVIG